MMIAEIMIYNLWGVLPDIAEPICLCGYPVNRFGYRGRICITDPAKLVLNDIICQANFLTNQNRSPHGQAFNNGITEIFIIGWQYKQVVLLQYFKFIFMNKSCPGNLTGKSFFISQSL